MYYYSPSTKGFYDSNINGKEIPNDAIKITKEDRMSLSSSQSLGKEIKVSEGKVFAIDRPSEPLLDILSRAKDEIRKIREPMLSAVTGIGWEASESGDDALVQEARNIRNALRDITDDPALNAAQTYEEMRAAGLAAYRSIAAGASPAFAATFKDFTGA